MAKTFKTIDADGRLFELKHFSDAYVVYALPRLRTLEIQKIYEIAVFNTLEEGQAFMSSLV